MFSAKETQLILQLVNERISSLDASLLSDKTADSEKVKIKNELLLANNIKSTIESKSQKPTSGQTLIELDESILVADDDLISRELTVSLLEDLGYTSILTALDGYHAMSAIKENINTDKPVKLVICDWNMPNMSGLELLEIIRKDPKLKGLPFFLISSNHDKAHIVTAIKAGVSGYLVKPISIKQLGSKLQANKEDKGSSTTESSLSNT